MNEIKGIDLAKINEQAAKAFQKIAESRVTDYLRGLMVQAHNLSMKSMRLRNEADQASSSAEKIADQIAKIQAGDWSAIEPMELSEK